MPMQMGFRWYGEGNDKIPLSYIKQIPGQALYGRYITKCLVKFGKLKKSQK